MEGDSGGGGGGGDGANVGHVDQVQEERLALPGELRMLKKAARDREICDELEYWRRLQTLATLRDERADLVIELEACDVGVAAYGRGSLSDVEQQELAFLHCCIAFKSARVHELALQISDIQLSVRKLAEIVRLHEQRRADKDASRAEVFRADGLSALNVSAAATPNGQCPEGGITRSCIALATSSHPDGGDTCEVKVEEESDGAGEQQQPERQQQPRQLCLQQQQQDHVVPVSTCDDRPEEEVEEVEGVSRVEEGEGPVVVGVGVEQKGRVGERAKVGAGGRVCIVGWVAEHGRKRRRCPKRERVKER